MTEIDCEMLDKAVNHHRSADLGPARGDQLEVGLHRAPFSRASCGWPINVYANNLHHMFCYIFGNTTVYNFFFLLREYLIIYDRNRNGVSGSVMENCSGVHRLNVEFGFDFCGISLSFHRDQCVQEGHLWLSPECCSEVKRRVGCHISSKSPRSHRCSVLRKAVFCQHSPESPAQTYLKTVLLWVEHRGYP